MPKPPMIPIRACLELITGVLLNAVRTLTGRPLVNFGGTGCEALTIDSRILDVVRCGHAQIKERTGSFFSYRCPLTEVDWERIYQLLNYSYAGCQDLASLRWVDNTDLSLGNFLCCDKPYRMIYKYCASCAVVMFEKICLDRNVKRTNTHP